MDGQQAHEKMRNIPDQQRNAYQNYYEVDLSEWPSLISLQISNSREDVEKREPSFTVGGNVKGTITMENSMEVPQKTTYRTII